MAFLIKLLQGFLIGTGMIAPGVSGGTVAVVFGLYDKITDAISHFYRDTLGKIKFFLPVAIGGVVGVVLFSKVMSRVFEDYWFQSMYLFFGLMLGSLPSVFKDASKKGFKLIYIIPFAVTVAASVGFALLDRGDAEALVSAGTSVPMMIVYGMVVGLGMIIPGVSSSVVLLYLGSYDIVLGAISDFDVQILIPVGIGCVLSVVLFAKLINWLLRKYYGMTFFAVLGFVCGSMVMIFPGFDESAGVLILSVILLALGTVATYRFGLIRKEELD